MNREEAWNRIDAIIAKHEIDDEYVTITSILDYDALRMAREILEQQPCDDAISRKAAISAMREETCGCCWDARDILKHLPSVSMEKTDAYKQGWHDAIDMALKEAYTIHHYGEIFRVVQEETLMGLGMAYVSDTNDGKMGESEG